MRHVPIILLLVFLTACGGPSPDQVQATITTAMQQTAQVLAAQPTPTAQQVEVTRIVTQVVTQVATVVVTATPQPATPTPAQPSATPAPAMGKWLLTTDTSSFDDSTTVVLLLDAEREVVGPFETTRPTLILRCQEKETEAYINLDMQADVEGADNTATVRLRLDQGKPYTAITDKSTDNKALFLPKPKAFITSLLDAEQLTFGFTPFNGSPVETVFDLRGLSEAIPTLREACP